jgi:flagellar protein FlgJ
MSSATSVPSIFDSQPLTALKGAVRQDDPKALKAAAQQFEAVFLQMVLKSMRAAAPQDGMFDSDQTRFYQELLDSQLAQVMSAKGGTGLASMIERQLSRASERTTRPDGSGGFLLDPPATEFSLPQPGPGLPLPQGNAPLPLPLDGSPVRSTLPPVNSISSPAAGAAAQDFTRTLWPYAAAAGQQTGIPPQFLLAHAALESGWGRSEPRSADGRNSYNLFGIKAGTNWTGPVVDAVTTEYAGGNAERRVERFRAYGSYAEAFADYANLLKSQPRYAQVLGAQDAASFSRGLQSAGYATDPQYGKKLLRVIGSISIGSPVTG